MHKKYQFWDQNQQKNKNKYNHLQEPQPPIKEIKNHKKKE